MPYSTYSRIFDILKTLGQDDGVNIFDFSRHLHDEGIESLAIFRGGPAGSIKDYCSAAAIRRLIRLATRLKLISIEDRQTCKLTEDGKRALSPDDYGAVLGLQIRTYLREQGFSYENLLKTVRDVKHPDIPDLQTIYESARDSGLAMNQDDFRKILNLLHRCDLLDHITRRLWREPR